MHNYAEIERKNKEATINAESLEIESGVVSLNFLLLESNDKTVTYIDY